MTYVLAFLASGGVVVLAGTALARHADAIAEATRLGRLWIGSVLLAAATSLPELATDIAAVRLGAADLAVGDLFGSSLANMLILALVLALIKVLPSRGQAASGHALAASLAIGLNTVAAVLVLIRPGSSIFWVGPGSLLLFLAYVAGTRVMYLHALNDGAAPTPSAAAENVESARLAPSLRRAVLRFAGASLVVLLAAPVFAWSAKGIAEISGLGNTFVGTWLIGIATSLPELAASIAAIRMGAFDLAVGNLFGSNAFNMAIFFPLDLVQPGSLFAALDPNHALSGLFAVVLMSLGLAAIVHRAKRRFTVLELCSALMPLAYAVALWILYRHSAEA